MKISQLLMFFCIVSCCLCHSAYATKLCIFEAEIGDVFLYDSNPTADDYIWSNQLSGQTFYFAYLFDVDSFDINNPSTYNITLDSWSELFFIENELLNSLAIETSIHQTSQTSGEILNRTGNHWNKLYHGDMDFNWSVGSVVYGTSWWHTDDFSKNRGFDYGATLVSMETLPVPEPGTIVLFSLGIITILLMKKKRMVERTCLS